MRALDLFCCAGGAAMGLHRAGFDVTGVDVRPQPRYPFRFVQADALQPPVRLRDFDFIWASPPCQAFSSAAHSWRIAGRQYPDLISTTRAMLLASGVPFVIENVPQAPIRADVVLDGTMFPPLKVIRKRHFELHGFWAMQPESRIRPGLVSREGWSTVTGTGRPSGLPQECNATQTVAACSVAMGIDWMNRKALSQAIPPAYSEFIARAFLTQQPARAA